MRVAHIILVHKNPIQLERLLNALQHPEVDCYIHLDRKSDKKIFAPLLNREQVFLIQNNIKLYWGEYSLVQATLNSMEEVLERESYDYVNVISGQDFPIQSADALQRFLHDHAGTEFITSGTAAGGDEWWEDARLHVWRYNFHNWRIPGRYRMEKLANKLLPPRKYPLSHTIAGGSNWFTVTSGAARFILDFLRENPKVVRFFKFVWGADEFVFSTILYNSDFRSRIQDNLVYIDWTEKRPNPKTLTTADLNKLPRFGKLFARKFDMDVDPRVLDLLEERLGLYPPAVTPKVVLSEPDRKSQQRNPS